MSSQPTDTIYVNSPQTSNSQQVTQSDSAANVEQSLQNFNGPHGYHQPTQAPVFYQIIEIVTEFHRGNYLPVLHCLRYNLIPKDYLDYTGYSFLHHAVSQASVPITLILLDYFKVDVNIRSKNNQTALMIACNYGLVEIIRILCERGALISEQDDTRFSALLYSVKNGRIPQLCYLLHQNADLQVRDANGCTVIHWAAYKNDVFQLKMFAKLGVDLNALDSNGLTALDRAVQSESHDAVKFLLAAGNGKMPQNMKFETLPEGDTKEMLRRKFYPTRREKLQDKCLTFLKTHSQYSTFGVYAVLWLFMMSMYLNVVMYKGFGYTFDLLFLLLNLYFIVYVFWYYTKSAQQLSKVKEFAYKKLNKSVEALDETANSIEMRMPSRSRLNFDALDKLMRGNDSQTVIHDVEHTNFPSFLHEIALNFETKNYRELSRFDQKEYCPSCLTKKSNRSAHVEEINACTPHFHHYSHCLGVSIDKSNHFLYLVLLIKQMLLLGMFIIGLWATYMEDIENTKIWFLETAYKLTQDNGLSYGFFYVVFLIAAGYNFIFLMIEIYGVVHNVTYHELFHRNSYNNMFKVKKDQKGQFVKHHVNPYDLGMLENIKEYVRRILH